MSRHRFRRLRHPARSVVDRVRRERHDRATEHQRHEALVRLNVR